MVIFKKSDKQKQAIELMNRHMHTLLYGGSRSGKTFIICRNILLRGLKKPSRHLLFRKNFNHAKTSLWNDTLPKVMELCFPGVYFHPNKSDWYFSVEPRGSFGGESQFWVGGVDDKERTEKVLGTEYSTIYGNELSQVSYDSYILMLSRLAETSGLDLKFYGDLNPCGKKHWTYQQFIEKRIPGTKDVNELDTAYILINPKDNIENLSQEYIKLLESFPKRQRQRFLEGLFLSDVEGALWTDKMISEAKAKEFGDIVKTVVAVDPSVINSATSDEVGIVVSSLDEFDNGVVEDDFSGVFSTSTWAQRAVNAYYHYNANCIVAEVNQGGDLVVDAIKAVDRNVPVVKVRASKGKFARAEPVSGLYEQGRVAHVKSMPGLEDQMTQWVPMNTSESPGRIDALTWGLTYLILREEQRKIRVEVI